MDLNIFEDQLCVNSGIYKRTRSPGQLVYIFFKRNQDFSFFPDFFHFFFGMDVCQIIFFLVTCDVQSCFLDNIYLHPVSGV